MTQSRRTFLKTGAALGLASVARPRGLFADMQHETEVTPRLSQFGYGDVELLEGPLREQFDTNHAFYLGLNEDSLLKPFRQRAGLPAPGEDMGGWYDNSTDFDPHGNFHGFIPGHSFGQYLSGLSRDYAATGSKPTRAKVERLVKAFAPTITSKFYDDYHLPAYTFDKINCGLIDAYEFAWESSALEVLNAATDAVLPHLPKRAYSRAAQYEFPHKDEAYCWDEPYTLPENLFLAWQRGAGSRFRDLGVRFLADDWYFNLLAAGPVLILFVVNLMAMGWWVSLAVVSLILRHGAGAEALAWSVLFGLAPFSCVFYPVATLPAALRPLALCLPAAHVFEGMRAALGGGGIAWDHLLWASGLNLAWMAAAFLLFARQFRAARIRGALLTIGE